MKKISKSCHSSVLGEQLINAKHLLFVQAQELTAIISSA